jgi:hypothetical protein
MLCCGKTHILCWNHLVVVVVPLGVPLRGPDTLPDAAGYVRLDAASEEAAGTAAVPVPLAVGLSVPLGLLISA